MDQTKSQRNAKNRFLLVYGSETGQAMAIASEIAEKCTNFGLVADLHCLDETGKRFNIEEERCMVMVTSTTGDGDAPANASKFFRRIKKRTLTNEYLSHLNYTLLGLGDSNYTNFCRCARDMDTRLQELGAKKFYATGLADDGVGLEVVADPWLTGLYPALQSFLDIVPDATPSALTDNVDVLSTSTVSQTNNLEIDKFANEKCSINQIDSISLKTELDIIKNMESMHLSDNKSDLDEDGNKMVASFEENCQTQIDSTSHISISAIDKNYKIGILPPYVNAPCLRKTDSGLSTKQLTVPVLSPPYLSLQYSDTPLDISSLNHQNGYKLPSSTSEIFHVPIVKAKALTHKDAVKKALLLGIDIKNINLSYKPGDAISIICPNDSTEVGILLNRLGVTSLADKSVSLALIPDTKKRRAAVPPHVHSTTTLRHAFTTCLSIREPPSKALIRVLAEHTSDANEKRRLQELCSKEGADEYTHYIREPCVSILDVLLTFPSSSPPVERLIEHLTRLQPRPYSACSYQSSSKDVLEIVFNVVEVPKDHGKGHLYSRRGVCTGWLDEITTPLQEKASDNISGVIEIPIFLRGNQHFRHPDDLSKPLILIGPGTGVAPFIGFLQERSLRSRESEKGVGYGQTWLFFGCRNKDKDYIFREELEAFEKEDIITKLCVSFSRDGESDRRYVQDYMRHEAEELGRCFHDEDTLVYVCGDAKNMAKDVNSAFQEILQSQFGMSTDDAHMFIMKKRIHKTYLEDVWV